jgi:tetratricopeptide (TPR) repeat protein
MSRNILALLITVLVTRSGWSLPGDEPSEMLARAEALYYEADFAKSIELLLRADELLRQQSGNLKEKTDVKLQLALSFIGLNDIARAKAYLQELYALDLDRRIDPQMYSPKVLRLADEAKAEQNEIRCRTASEQAQRQLDAGNSAAVVRLLGSTTGCPALGALNAKVADLSYKEGLDAYKKGRMEEALQKFRTAARLDSTHELAAQYVDLTERKLEVNADRALLAWRKDFAAGDYAQAALDYRELVSLSRAETVDDVRKEYRQALNRLVDAWNRACATDDNVTMKDVRERINQLIPEPSFANDIVGRMTTCTHTGCIPMGTQLALTRLKSRVDPQFSALVISQLKITPVTVRVKARINEKGEPTATELNGGNPLLYNPIRAAFEQWRFTPALVEGESRCVETEIPIVINFATN